MSTKYRVEAEGQVFTRTSDRIYTHVIIVRRNTRSPGNMPDLWVAFGWAGRPDLAQKTVAVALRHGWSEAKAVGVAPSVTGTVHATTASPMAAAPARHIACEVCGKEIAIAVGQGSHTYCHDCFGRKVRGGA